MNKIDALFVAAPSPFPSMIVAYAIQGMPPLGLGYMATYLRQHGYATEILDMALPSVSFSDLRSILLGNDVKIVGLSCTTETYKTAMRLAEMVKELRSETIVVVGGPHVSFEYASALRHDSIDYVVPNEGELAFKKLCDFAIRGIGEKESLRGIAYAEAGDIRKAPPMPFIEDLDSLPIPDRKLFGDLNRYALAATVSTSRGCPGQCVFCSAGVLSGGKYRLRSAKNVIEEFAYLKSLGHNHIYVVDDTMTADLSRLDSFLEGLISSELGVTWYCESRIDAVSKPMLDKMKKAGATSLQFGVEAGTQGTLDCIKKNIALGQVYDVFDWCRDLGISAMTNMIVGLPGDSMSSLNETMKLAKELTDKGSAVTFSVCTPFPGTPLWESPEKFGAEIVCDDLDFYTTSCPVMRTEHLTVQEIRNEYCRAVFEIGQGRAGRISAKAGSAQDVLKFFPQHQNRA